MMGDRCQLLKIAAAAHRAKWEFADTDEPAFRALHRIGDMAKAAYDKSSGNRTNEKGNSDA